MDSKELYQFNAQIAELGKEAPSSQQVEYLKVSMLGEIALQLAKQNEALANIAEMLHIIADKEAK